MHKYSSILVSLLTVFVLVASLLMPLGVVMAEGETPTEPTATEPVATEVPALEPTPESTPVVAETPAEVIQSLPENTGLVVLDEQGNPVPLVSEEAAEIISEGDPVWCPDPQTPANDMDDGVQDCTEPFNRFTGSNGLLNELAGGSYTGDGTIFVANGTIASGDQNKTIVINGNNLTGLTNFMLGIQGGWNFTTKTIDYEDASYFYNSGISIINWGGNIWVDNIITDGAPNDGLNIETEGLVAVTNSEFYGSDGFGLDITTTSNDQENVDVYLDNVISQDNYDDGARIHAINGTVDVENSDFSYNGWGKDSIANGLTVRVGTDGDSPDNLQSITLMNVLAAGNTGHGAILRNHLGWTDVYDGEFYNNGNAGIRVENDWGDIWLTFIDSEGNDNNGIRVEAGNSDVYVDESYASDNSNGLYIGNADNVFISDSIFVANYNNGTRMEYVDGLVEITGSVLNNNDDSGARLDDIGQLVVSGSEFSYNYGFSKDSGGLYALVYGDAYVENSFFNGNGFLDFCIFEDFCIQEYNDAYGLAIQTGGGAYASPQAGSPQFVKNISNDITLVNVEANYNGAMGAGLNSSFGNIEISDSSFDYNGNVCFWYGDCSFENTIHNSQINLTANGLDATTYNMFYGYGSPVPAIIVDEEPTSGNITLLNTTANGNAVNGATLFNMFGDVTVTDGKYNGNGYGCEYMEGDCGAYLFAPPGAGLTILAGLPFLIPVGAQPAAGTNSLFPPMPSGGTLFISNTTANENSVVGAFSLGGNTTVTNSSFNGNGEVGLYVGTFDEEPVVTLDHVTADNNGYIGAIVMAGTFGPPSSAAAIDEPPALAQSTVIIKCGSFSNNGDIGLQVMADILELYGPVLEGNGEQPYFFAGTTLVEGVCPAGDPGEPEKPVKPIHEIPVGTGGSGELLCDQYSGTLLILENGDKVLLPCFIQDTGTLFTTLVDKLPAELPGGKDSYASALELTVTKEGQEVDLIEDGIATVFFKIPDELKEKNLNYGIMYWDQAANDGAGAWVELPARAADENGNNITFPLHDPSDGKYTMMGVHTEGGYVKVLVNYTGIFALFIK